MESCKAFFNCLKNIFSNRAYCGIICIEERPNFMTDSMSVRCHERDRVLKYFDWLQMSESIIVEKLVEPNHYFEFKRERLALYKVLKL